LKIIINYGLFFSIPRKIAVQSLHSLVLPS
jgi:hypothetical protein